MAPELFVTEAFLRRRFEIIRDGGYMILPLGEAVARLRGGTLPGRSVVITFDDGFYNFIAAAAPLLESSVPGHRLYVHLPLHSPAPHPETDSQLSAVACPF